MNDPNKAISVNLSSLLSLKAELLRKQQEVKLAKATKSTASEHVPKKSEQKLKQTPKLDDDDLKYAKVEELEDSAQLEKSRRVLEAKSKYYERMSRSGGKLNSDDNCLVLFNRKRQEDEPSENELVISPKLSSDSSDSDNNENTANVDDDDWVEYTDCLGRTRKCLRKDFEYAKRRDEELAASMPERLDQNRANWMIDTKVEDDEYGPKPTESIYSEGCSLISKHEEQRVNWERKEQENFDKPDVHYQDVFFDEARQHGVGYYAFSTDEEERKRQQIDLEKARKQTLTEQQKREAFLVERDRLVFNRMVSAKNRIRAREGLPPLTEEEIAEMEQKLKQPEIVKETKEQRKKRRRAEKEKLKQDQLAAEREKERQEHIRPWDLNKDGMPSSISATTTTKELIDGEPEEWQYREQRLPMSQEEWNEKQRAVRNTEFAPIPEYTPKRMNFTSMPPPATPLPHKYTSFQSTKRDKTFHRRNTAAADEFATDVTQTTERERNGVAIPPPSNLDSNYGLPTRSKKPKTHDELERSIEAGLRFLRDSSDKGNATTKSSWTAKADY